MKLTMLGTGNASVIKCYNSCFLLTENENHILVDGGGGSTIFKQLESVNVNWMNIHSIIVTHKHMDHFIGVLWIIRMFCQYTNRKELDEKLTIYSHNEVIFLIKDFMEKFLEKKDLELINKKLFLKTVNDDETIIIMDKKVTFFDIRSSKTKQFGFQIEYDDNKKLTCCGDEPYNETNKRHVKNSEWLVHEAFCLKSEEKMFKAYEKNHSTVKDACETAQKLGINNLILYHTEDKNIKNRKEIYLNEGKNYYKGNLYIPYDLEEILL